MRRFSDFLNKTVCEVIRSTVPTPTRCHAIIVEWNEWKVKHPPKRTHKNMRVIMLTVYDLSVTKETCIDYMQNKNGKEQT